MIARALVALSVPALAFVWPPAAADIWEKAELYGDLRLRMEQDWDSRRGDGTRRDDRLRLRYRLRGGIKFEFDDRWSARVSLRSGQDGSQQSSHTTIKDFNGGDDGPYDFNFDHWYVAYGAAGFDVWAGRHELSFLHQTEIIVFDNITYRGIGGSYRRESGGSTWHASLNLVELPAGMEDFVGTAVVGQIAFDRQYESSGYTIGLGYDLINADADDPDGALLLTENNERDYSVISLQTQYRSVFAGRPLRLGFDVSYNLEDYGDEPLDTFSGFHDDHVNGFVAQALWGDTSEPRDWQLGYFYAYQEALTGNSSYTQDEWVRWGSGGQTRATNFRGSEFRARYTISERMNVIGRLFLVEAIDLLEPGDVAKEDGRRFRVDCNIRF